MGNDDPGYHREREQQCRTLAAGATDPDIRRRHEELAELHASRAAQQEFLAVIQASAG